MILPNQKEETDSLKRGRGARKKKRSYQPGTSRLSGDVKTVETQGLRDFSITLLQEGWCT